MDERMAVLAQTLEVVEGEGHVGVIDVLRRKVDDMMNDLGWLQLAVRVTTLAHQWGNKAEWRFNGTLHVCLAIVSPSWRMIEGDGPILRHYSHLPSSVQWVKSLRRPHY